MTRAQELKKIHEIDALLEKYNLTNKDYLFPKDIAKAFGYSRQMLEKWCKDETIALDHVWHTPNKRKYSTKEFRNFLIRLWTKGEYLTK
jgi:hypothetical protein